METATEGLSGKNLCLKHRVSEGFGSYPEDLSEGTNQMNTATQT